ncbi:DMT family transporter [Tomitella biformata]|uniref:DMT family transporter n=1 Tax=Tomitella biformata TaxID=630403 RepID=UPI0004660264|nr:SMR family transporter [Tomitella biformata]
MTTWLLLIVAILLEVTGTMCLTASDGLSKRRWILPVGASYLASLALVSVVLGRGMTVGVVYGIWVAGGVALTAVLGRVIFKDPLTLKMIAGIGLIMAGVLFIEIGAMAG